MGATGSRPGMAERSLRLSGRDEEDHDPPPSTYVWLLAEMQTEPWSKAVTSCRLQKRKSLSSESLQSPTDPHAMEGSRAAGEESPTITRRACRHKKSEQTDRSPQTQNPRGSRSVLSWETATVCTPSPLSRAPSRETYPSLRNARSETHVTPQPTEPHTQARPSLDVLRTSTLASRGTVMSHTQYRGRQPRERPNPALKATTRSAVSRCSVAGAGWLLTAGSSGDGEPCPAPAARGRDPDAKRELRLDRAWVILAPPNRADDVDKP